MWTPEVNGGRCVAVGLKQCGRSRVQLLSCRQLRGLGCVLTGYRDELHNYALVTRQMTVVYTQQLTDTTNGVLDNLSVEWSQHAVQMCASEPSHWAR